MSANKAAATSNHSQSTRPVAHTSSTGLPTPASSPQANSTASSPSPTASARQPRGMHNMSISSILSPDDHATTAATPSSNDASSSSVCSAGSRSSVAEDAPSAQAFTWNEDPKKIDDMLRTLNPNSAEWVVWKDWADFLAEERENQANERRAAASAAAAQGTG